MNSVFGIVAAYTVTVDWDPRFFVAKVRERRADRLAVVP